MKKLKEKFIKIESFVIEMYENEENITNIAKFYNTSGPKIKEILNKNKINLQQGATRIVSKRKYNLNENYFKEIDTPNKAYWLGLLYADGYNEENRIVLSLQEEDSYILEKFKIDLNYEVPLRLIKKRSPSHQNQYKLIIYGKKFSSILKSIGMIRKKSLILDFPNIEESLFPHFIRGYFDGDGRISYPKNKPNKGNVTICCSEKFSVKLIDILKEHVGLSPSLFKQKIYKVGFGGRLNLLKFMDWIYKDCGDLFLKRKLNRFLEIKNYKNIT